MAKLSPPYDADPRLEGGRPGQYKRDNIIAAIGDFYDFLTRLPYLQPHEVHHPPVDGWPNINKEQMAPLGKSDEVVELLAHLPYISTKNEKGWCPVAPHSQMLDFRGESFQEALEKGTELAKYPNYVPPFIDLPPWGVSLTTGRTHGQYWLLDTSDGTITRYFAHHDYDEPDYAPEDPRHWRNEHTYITKPVYLAMSKEKLRSLECIACCKNGVPKVILPPEDPKRGEKIRRIYEEHGWPGNLRREECRSALITEDRSRG